MAGRLRRSLPQAVVAETDEWVEVAPDAIVDVVRWLHDDPDLDAAQLSNLCATDRYDHFEVVYHLQSLDQNHQIVVKARVGEHERASLPSVYPVYKGRCCRSARCTTSWASASRATPTCDGCSCGKATPGSRCAKTSCRSRAIIQACPTSHSKRQDGRSDDDRE